MTRSLVPTEIVEISALDVRLTSEEILADLLYPESPPHPERGR